MPEEFGANEWLVEEMHDRFQQDPSSVEPTWAAYFSGNGSGNGSGDAAAPAKPAEVVPAEAKAAEPKPAQQTEQKPAPQTEQKTVEAEHKDPTP
ncbi:hypothetical protein, partial [Nocardioides sp.]|uniref:2-oxoglutarate dehydrogenase E1 subunit family protein n=1 Tax=Nocardioides sp. TaxID=35761 RepID=UPI001A2A0295|nr:hypothetical protein [Nocardioides sp.]